ncbi:MAG: hypothetical protein M1826_001673 [Phylliscum demangeonii]|nr:MAG: hypothetical protein M1826_001673 [Phylliscum demangeonii]
MAQSFRVIALISGGKDSLFSILHCLANGHQVVALANLHPARLPLPDDAGGGAPPSELDDLDSYLYQTIGHHLIPLYQDALGIPVYRQEIIGSAIDQGKTYSGAPDTAHPERPRAPPDETESLLPLLRRIRRAHPEADAVSTGAILSDYQRTRIEHVVTRLGLVPLAYLWQYPCLPPAGTTAAAAAAAPASLLADMMAVGQEARIIKVASGALHAGFLWENVASRTGVARLSKAMARFGTTAEGGAVLGEGGEYETVALDGPRPLWKMRIVVPDGAREAVQTGAGAAVLKIATAHLAPKMVDDAAPTVADVRMPPLLEPCFEQVLDALKLSTEAGQEGPGVWEEARAAPCYGLPWSSVRGCSTWHVWSMTGLQAGDSPELQTLSIVDRLKRFLVSAKLGAQHVVSVTMLLRSMDSFHAVNQAYAKLFSTAGPPSRITVALGDRLPEGVHVLLSATIGLGPLESRQALHVQSRSYWAPANIGPYSQAVSTPACLEADEDMQRERIVYVAGQIPLVPATMEVVRGDGLQNRADALSEFRLQTVLSLQHLWRVGLSMGVRWWGGGVAFIAGDTAIPLKALVAWDAWTHRHRLESHAADKPHAPEDDDDFDVWDQKMGVWKDTAAELAPRSTLPDLGIVTGLSTQQLASSMFVVQVDELPRGCEIEWAGIGVVSPGVVVSGCQNSDGCVQASRLSGSGKTISHAVVDYGLDQDEVAQTLRHLIAAAVPACTSSSPPTVFTTVYTDRELRPETLLGIEVVCSKESNADYYLFLFPLHQVLLPVLRDLARTSLLPAETQLLAIGLVNLLIHAVSPQAVTLTALLWGGGLGILVLCRPVLRVSKILSNVLRLRLSEKAPSMGDSDADEDGPPGLRRRAESLGAKPEPGLLRSVGVPAAIESAHQASLAWNPSCPSVQVHRMTSVPHQAVFGHPRSYTFSAADRWNVRHRQLGENGVARWHQHRVPLFVQSFLSLTPAQALLRKWLYAAYVYVVTAMIIFMGIGVYVKDYALQGRDPIGWALGYLFGDLPWVRDGISALSGARWLCRSSPWTEEGQEEVRSGPAEYIRQVYLGPGNTRLLVMVYLAAVVVGGMAVVLQLRDAVEVDTRRKVFHGMMVVMFLPAIFVDPVFAGFAMMLVLAVFLLLEVLRASQLPPLSKPLAAFLTPYVDGRDLRGPVVVSHMFLLIGCAVPLWLSLARLPRTGTGCERGWEVPRREMGMVSGVICVGMGDAAASLVGRRWGRHKWPWPGGKSLEGSLAFFVAVVTGLRIARAWAWTGGWFHSDVVRVNDLMKLTTAAGAASLTEAVLTGGNDNVIVPIILWLLVVGLNI